MMMLYADVSLVMSHMQDVIYLRARVEQLRIAASNTLLYCSWDKSGYYISYEISLHPLQSPVAGLGSGEPSDEKRQPLMRKAGTTANR